MVILLSLKLLQEWFIHSPQGVTLEFGKIVICMYSLMVISIRQIIWKESNISCPRV